MCWMLMVYWEVRITFSYNISGWRGEKIIFLGLLLVVKVCIKKKKKVQVFQNYCSPSTPTTQLYVVTCSSGKASMHLSYKPHLNFLRLFRREMLSSSYFLYLPFISSWPKIPSRRIAEEAVIEFCAPTPFMLTHHLNYTISNDTNQSPAYSSELLACEGNKLCAELDPLPGAVVWGLNFKLLVISPLPFLPCFGFGLYRH